MILFVVLPFALAAVLVPLYAWRTSGRPTPPLTRDILATGVPAQARIVAVRNMGTIVDLRPMVRFNLQVTTGPGEEPFDLEVVQSLPRAAIYQFKKGDFIQVRLTLDRTAGAVVWNMP